MNPKFKPSKEFFRFVKNEYSKTRYGYGGYSIEPYVQEKLLSAAYGLTAWLKTKKGANWVFALMGVEEIEPHFAYEYFLRSINGAPERPLDRKCLRIFKKTSKEMPGLPVDATEIAKKVIFTEGWKSPDDDTVKTVLIAYRNWLRSAAGMEWAKSNYSAIETVDNRDGVIFRYQKSGEEIYWLEHIQVEARNKEIQACECCEEEFPCVDHYTGMGDICNRCYSENFGEPEILKYCNRPECRDNQCRNYLNEQKLKDCMNNIDKSPIKWESYG